MSSFSELKKRAVALGIKATGPGRTREVLEREIEAAGGNNNPQQSSLKDTAPKTSSKKSPRRSVVNTAGDNSPVLFFGYKADKIAKQPYILFSNWAFTPFVDDEGHWFASNEVYMMYRKVLLFNATVLANKILTLIPQTTVEPADWDKLMAAVKKLGRTKGIGFTDEVWEQHREQIMVDGLTLKMRAHPEIAQLLLSTGDRPIAEASHKDAIWGIGLAASNPDAQDPTKWDAHGLNLLGKALMTVRANLRAQQEQ